jgi:hypothetical protein
LTRVERYEVARGESSRKTVLSWLSPAAPAKFRQIVAEGVADAKEKAASMTVYVIIHTTVDDTETHHREIVPKIVRIRIRQHWFLAYSDLTNTIQFRSPTLACR